MTEQEAMRKAANEDSLLGDRGFELGWNSALEWARTQQEPVAFIGGTDGMLWQEQCDDNDIPLYVAPILPAPETPDVTGELREAVARAIWNIRREHEDRCDMELEDIGQSHAVWAEANAAINAMLAASPEYKGETK